MRITFIPSASATCKAHDLPVGSIGKVRGSDALYVIHTDGNGNEFLKVWPNAIPAGLEAITFDKLKELNWDVNQLPKGSKMEFTF